MIELVSIIIPIYNVEQYLKQCLDSVINQTYSNLQIILVNDGSTDSCLNICNTYAQSDDRIEIFSQKNKGLSAARNNGISHALGEYLLFIDSDDYISLDHVENLMQSVKEFDSDISICGYIEFFSDGKSLENQFDASGIVQKEVLFESLVNNEDIGNYAWNKIYKKSLFCNIEFPIGRVYEDIWTTYKLFDNAQKICVTNKATYYYRKRDNSISKMINFKAYKDLYEGLSKRNNYIKTHYPQLSMCCDNKFLECMIGIYNNISKKYRNIDELNFYRNIITEVYSMGIKCIQTKYRLMINLIYFCPHFYSNFLYFLNRKFVDDKN